jgi:hypothetical protein
MAYVIACNSRYNEENGFDRIIFMVDRRIRRDQWWSLHLRDAFVYRDARAAERKARSFRFNDARVIGLDEAKRIAHEQWLDRVEMEAMDSIEDGWDGHKVWI